MLKNVFTCWHLVVASPSLIQMTYSCDVIMWLRLWKLKHSKLMEMSKAHCTRRNLNLFRWKIRKHGYEQIWHVILEAKRIIKIAASVTWLLFKVTCNYDYLESTTSTWQQFHEQNRFVQLAKVFLFYLS